MKKYKILVTDDKFDVVEKAINSFNGEVDFELTSISKMHEGIQHRKYDFMIFFIDKDPWTERYALFKDITEIDGMGVGRVNSMSEISPKIVSKEMFISLEKIRIKAEMEMLSIYNMINAHNYNNFMVVSINEDATPTKLGKFLDIHYGMNEYPKVLTNNYDEFGKNELTIMCSKHDQHLVETVFKNSNMKKCLVDTNQISESTLPYRLIYDFLKAKINENKNHKF